MARPKIEITSQAIRQIEIMSGFGLTILAIASFLQISKSTLKRWKRDDRVSNAFSIGQARAELEVAQALYELATKRQDLGAIIWWEKTRAGRTERDIQQEVNDRIEVELKKVFTAARQVLTPGEFESFVLKLATSRRTT